MSVPPPDWPALMTPQTLAAYLDCLDANGKGRAKLRLFKQHTAFPEADPATGMFYRLEIDKFLDIYFGRADPVEATRGRLDRRFGT